MTKTYYFCLVPTFNIHTYHIQIAKFQNAVSGDDIYTLDIWGTFFITNLVFWSIGSIYCYFDVTTTPKFLRKYKIQPETNEPVDPKKFKNLIWTVFLNQTVVYIPLRLLKVIKIKSMKPLSKGPSTKDVRKYFPIFDPYPPHVCNRLHFKDPSLKRTSANQEFDPPPPQLSCT